MRALSVDARQLSLILLAVALTVAVYFPGLSGDFIFDDGPNITENTRLQTTELTLDGIRQAAFSADSGMLKRPISMLTFWVNYYLHGLDPYWFKVTNLLVHLLTGGALFVLAKFLLESPAMRRSVADDRSSSGTAIALAVATLWLVHPLNLTAVLYVVQRMTSLSALFIVLGLLCYVAGRRRQLQGRNGFTLILIGLFGFGALAVLSKENGALLPFFIVVVELTLFRFIASDAATTRKLKAFNVVISLVPILAIVLFLLTHPDWVTRQYETRDFTLAERLLTQARVLWLYLKWTLIPSPFELGLYHDDIAVSKSLFDPVTTIVSIAGLAGLLTAACVYRRKFPLFSFGVLWFFVGHALESSFIGLELVYEHRNYLPIMGPLLCAVAAVRLALDNVRWPVRAAVALGVVVALSFVTLTRAVDWGDMNRLRMALVRHHPNSPRANFEAGFALATAALSNPQLIDSRYSQIKAYFERSTDLDENSINGLFALILLDSTRNHTIDGTVLESLKKRLAESPLPFTTVGAFRSLLDWMIKGAVSLPQEDVRELFEAALGNPTASPRTLATLLSVFSAYQYSVVGDLQAAVSLAMAAVEMDPSEPVHRLSLADLAYKLGNNGIAQAALAEASRRDKLGRFTAQIKTMEHSIYTAVDGELE